MRAMVLFTAMMAFFLGGAAPLYGGGRGYHIHAGAGEDLIYGGAGADHLFSDSGGGFARLFGGADIDYACTSCRTHSQALNLTQASLAALLDGAVLSSIEGLFLSRGSDTAMLTGGRYEDVLAGGTLRGPVLFCLSGGYWDGGQYHRFFGAG